MRSDAPQPEVDVRIHSSLLQGYSHPDCVIPKCDSCMESTGFLVYRDGPLRGWFMEFQCPEHGQQLTQGGRWQALIDAALRERGAG